MFHYMTHKKDITMCTEQAIYNKNEYYKIYRIELYNQENVLYFDENWDIQEATLQEIVTTPSFLSKFTAKGTHMLIALFKYTS